MVQLLQSLLDKAKAPSFTYKIGDYFLEPNYIQAGLVIVLIFLLVLTMARMRHLYVNWHIGRHSISMVVWGFILAVIIEGFMLMGGSTILTQILGWRNAPKPISGLLNIARSQVAKVLGASDNEKINYPTSQTVMDEFKLLTPSEVEDIKASICKP